jgi:hypothetical protein
MPACVADGPRARSARMALKGLRSVMTVVGGKIVHDEGLLRVHER